MLKQNRSAPNTAVIHVLYYPDVRGAVEWLTTALPFTERLRIGDHRCQISHGNGAVVVAKPGGHADAATSTLQEPGAHSVTLRVTDIDALFLRAKAAGARVLAEPADHMYGERQCSFLDGDAPSAVEVERWPVCMFYAVLSSLSSAAWGKC